MGPEYLDRPFCDEKFHLIDALKEEEGIRTE